MSLAVYHTWKGLAPADRGAAVAFGNFDGVHLGHRSVIALAAHAARELGAPLGVISLEPHPLTLFQPGGPPFRLTNPHQMARQVELLGVDRLYLLPFGQQMANLSDHDFVRQILVGGLGVRHMAVGFDVTYGFGRTGGPDPLRRDAAEFGFTVSVAEEVAADGLKISSTAIREDIRQGHPDRAALVGGRAWPSRYRVSGPTLGRRVRHDKRFTESAHSGSHRRV